MDKAIAFDFDGVIADSFRETFNVTIIACEELGIKNPENEEEFRIGRKFVTKGSDYHTIARILESNPGIDFGSMTQEEFNDYKDKFSGSEDFKRKFYEIRSRLIKEDKEKWLVMHKVYPNITDAIKRLKKEFEVFLATAKNKEAVIELLDALDFRFIASNKLLTKEIYQEKVDQMNFISEKFNVPLNKILFIEDMVQNALAAKSIGVNVAVVEWGYSDENQREFAKSKGIPIIENDRIYEQIKSMADGM